MRVRVRNTGPAQNRPFLADHGCLATPEKRRVKGKRLGRCVYDRARFKNGKTPERCSGVLQYVVDFGLFSPKSIGSCDQRDAYNALEFTWCWKTWPFAFARTRIPALLEVSTSRLIRHVACQTFDVEVHASQCTVICGFALCQPSRAVLLVDWTCKGVVAAVSQ